MKILLANNNFSYLSGSPLYSYTLARELVLLGHEVTIYSPIIGGEITQKAQQAEVEVTNQIPTGKFDVMHLNQKVSEALLGKVDAPAIYTIHSEFDCEQPIRDTRIKKYIAIRPHIAKRWGIDCEIIYNPVDFERFHPFTKPKEELILFVGTIDPLRRKAGIQLIESGKKCKFIGQKFDSWANTSDWHDAVWDIENYMKDATATAGILLGRTTIEGWACGLPGYIFDIDQGGNVIGLELFEPPQDMKRFDSKLVAKQIEELYKCVMMM